MTNILLVFQTTVPPQSKIAKMLLILTKLSKSNLITTSQKAQLKLLVMQQNESVFSALEVFEIENDWNEFADTLIQILALNKI